MNFNSIPNVSSPYMQYDQTPMQALQIHFSTGPNHYMLTGLVPNRDFNNFTF